jgi:hypothetical protein
MSLRLKLAAIASAMFLAVGAAVSFAAPAFAKDKQVMGVTDAAGGDQWAYTNSAAAGQEVNMANTDGPSPPSVAREHRRAESESLCKMSLLPLRLSLIGDLWLLHDMGPPAVVCEC